ncbi:hypothetical protein UCRPC4_g00574 [Phaeomoniella chlamydospora]|uniref:Uncharacterized protein n=1 Tax=Phaeomoniella chlamydospora TaxID=158046 RepID=A0A0G2F0R4_PHACM|nr:hypothetical protein UCRPC4_g00574 [Phaeomoniella chlamydospora]
MLTAPEDDVEDVAAAAAELATEATLEDAAATAEEADDAAAEALEDAAADEDVRAELDAVAEGLDDVIDEAGEAEDMADEVPIAVEVALALDAPLVAVAAHSHTAETDSRTAAAVEMPHAVTTQPCAEF